MHSDAFFTIFKKFSIDIKLHFWRKIFLRPSKGQSNSKGFFSSWSFFQKMNKLIRLYYLFLFAFWKKVKTPKKQFEINWPLLLKKSLLILEKIIFECKLCFVAMWAGFGEEKDICLLQKQAKDGLAPR